MDRRDFVRRLTAAGPAALACAGVLPLGACAGVPYLVGEPGEGSVRVPLASVPEGSGAFVRLPGEDRPVYLHRGEGDEWIALLARCTHRGCQPEPVADRLVCPCHGSEFDLEGRVLLGPAERPLVRYPVEVRGAHAVLRLTGARP